MRVLLVTANWSETIGHAVRSIAVAERLLKEGHTVGLLGPESYREWVSDGTVFFPSVPKLQDIGDLSVFFGFHTYEDTLYASGHIDDHHLKETIGREREVIRQFDPDVILGDTQFTIGISANLEQVPLASIATWPMHPEFNSQVESGPRKVLLKRIRLTWNRVLSSLNLEPIHHMSELIFGCSQALLAPTCQALEPEIAQICPHIDYVGQLVPERMFQEIPSWLESWYTNSHEEEGLLVYVYLSSLPVGINSKEAFEAICEAFAETSHYVVFGFGKYNEERIKGIPYLNHPRYRFERFVPGESLMERAHLAIFPGTHSMMISAVKNGVACLVIPDLFEREYNAGCMERVGMGSRLDPEAMSAQNIRNWALEQRQMIRKMNIENHTAKQELLHMDGPERVLRRLKELAANKGGVKNALQRI